MECDADKLRLLASLKAKLEEYWTKPATRPFQEQAFVLSGQHYKITASQAVIYSSVRPYESLLTPGSSARAGSNSRLIFLGQPRINPTFGVQKPCTRSTHDEAISRACRGHKSCRYSQAPNHSSLLFIGQ